MSKLNELIQELCPNGVEYRKISSFTKVLRGKRLTKDKLSEENSIPVYHGGIEPLGYYGKANRLANMVMIINVGASAGTVAYSDKEFWSSDGCFCIDKNEEMDDRYLYHYLKNNEYYFMSKVRKAGIPTLDNFIVEEFKIPVPPLEVQREIVHILDSFTLLTAELTAELTARKKQYEYYRDMLLTFDARGGAISDVVWRTLGEVCNLQSGKAISAYLISDTQTVENSIPCYGANGLRGYVSTSNESGDKPIVGRQGALCGNVCFATGSYYATEHAVVVTDKGFFNSRFLYHLLVNADLNQYKTAGAQPGLSVARLNEVKVPVPKRTVQDRIANVLDNFDAICSDLNSGLPAEIEARQKQYEYYRDKLLTFKEM